MAEVTCVISRKNKLFEIDILNNSTLKVGDKLFTAPPAAVAVFLPERQKMRPYQTVDRGSTNYKAGWNACLDATAALNTVHVGDLDPAQRLALARGEDHD